MGLPVRRALKETAFGLGSGNLALNGEPQHELLLIEWECQGQSKDSFVQKERRKFRDSHIQDKNTQGFGGGGIEKKSSQRQCLIRSDKAYAIAVIRSSTVQKSVLLAAIQKGTHRHDFSYFVDEPPLVAQGGKGVVVAGCRPAGNESTR